MKSVCCSGRNASRFCVPGEALAEPAARPDRDLRLDHVVARVPAGRSTGRGTRAGASAGTASSLLPQRSAPATPITTFATTRTTPSHEVRPVPEHEREQQQEPRAPEPVLNARMQADDRAREQHSSVPRHARPEQHREEDPDEHDARAQVGLRHDEHPRDAARRPPACHSSSSDRGASRYDASTFASISTTVSFASSDGLAEAHAADREPALHARRGAGARAEDQRDDEQARSRAGTPGSASTRGGAPTPA